MDLEGMQTAAQEAELEGGEGKEYREDTQMDYQALLDCSNHNNLWMETNYPLAYDLGL